MLLGIGWALVPPYPFADYRTSTGERRTVRLSDGTTAELSTATALSLAFDGQTRRLLLHAGEAFFTVAPDPTRPFTVEAAGGSITALGTAFAVAHHASDVRVTVTQHTVLVATGTARVQLPAGHQLHYSGGQLGAAEAVNPDMALAWRQGHLVFLATPFGQVIKALEPWHPGRILVMDAALASRPVTVMINIRRPKTMLHTLRSTLPIRVATFSPYLTLIYPAAPAHP